MLYSDKLLPFAGDLPVSIQSAIYDIAQYFGVDSPKVLSYDETHVVIPVVFDVSLPSRGAVNGIDIRPQEPMLIKLNLNRYPDLAPITLSDRLDFPKSKLSHLYFTESDKPASLCLVRNSLHEWFAKIRIDQYLHVVSQWLYKAATNQLDEDGGEFDPFRLEGNILIDHIYRYSILSEVVVNDLRLLPNIPVALFAGGQMLKNGDLSAYQTTVNVPLIALEEVLMRLRNLPRERPEDAPNPIFTLVFWSESAEVETGWPALPKNYDELKQFFSNRGINLHQVLLTLEKSGIFLRSGQPIMYALKRPSKVVGYDGVHEFLNFMINLPAGGVKDIEGEQLVFLQPHVEPLSADMAKFLSGRGQYFPTLYLGAGSLGSKTILHDARAGNLNFAVCDSDKMLPHNLARHALTSKDVGRNKAKAIVAEIQQFYPCTDTSNVIDLPYDITLLTAELERYKRIVDTTASTQVLNFMTRANVPEYARYYKGEIADEGALGLFYAEGPGRNPRMDDLVNLAFYLALKKPQLQLWRRNDATRKLTNLNVGLGCSSTTAIMSDDVISFYASLFSRWIQKGAETELNSRTGTLALTSLDERSGLPVISSEHMEVKPFSLLSCSDGSGWMVRMIDGLEKELLEQCSVRAPKETGGVLIGVANYKTKVIHVFDMISEPQGSFGTNSRFIRGAKGLPSEIAHIKEVTGGTIGYIGEWHSHPMNLKALSTTDRQTISQLRELNRQVPIPTCSLVVTPDELLVFVTD